jgi:hypothetical protein
MIVEKKESKEFEIPEDGLYQAVLADVVDLGEQPTQFGDKHRARFIYILSETDSEGRPFRLMQQLNVSLHEKSGMAKIVKRLLGKDPGESFDLDLLIGKQCQLDVIRNEGKEGRIFANVNAVLSPIKSQAVGIPADFVRDCNKDKEEKPVQKTAPKPAAPKTATKQTVAPKTQTTRVAPTGIEVGPQEGSEGNVDITDEDIPF